MRNRRREPRVNVDGEITVKIHAAPGLRNLEGQIFLSHASDVSFGGLQMHLEIDIPVGTLLGLEIVLADSSMKYWHLGKVMWKKYSPADDKKQNPYYKIGIMFESFDNAMHDLWISKVMNILEKLKTN